MVAATSGRSGFQDKSIVVGNVLFGRVRLFIYLFIGGWTQNPFMRNFPTNLSSEWTIQQNSLMQLLNPKQVLTVAFVPFLICTKQTLVPLIVPSRLLISEPEWDLFFFNGASKHVSPTWPFQTWTRS